MDVPVILPPTTAPADVRNSGPSPRTGSQLRVMLIHGARTVSSGRVHDHAQSRWINPLVARRGKHKTIVALANKLMRIVWTVLHSRRQYDMSKAFRAQPAPDSHIHPTRLQRVQ